MVKEHSRSEDPGTMAWYLSGLTITPFSIYHAFNLSPTLHAICASQELQDQNHSHTTTCPLRMHDVSLDGVKKIVQEDVENHRPLHTSLQYTSVSSLSALNLCILAFYISSLQIARNYCHSDRMLIVWQVTANAVLYQMLFIN